MLKDPLGSGIAVLPNGDLATAGHVPKAAKSKLYKTEKCQRWVKTGKCTYGKKCQFAHGEIDKRSILRHPKYKTSRCKNFLMTGKCPYENRCRFLHNELSEEKLESARNMKVDNIKIEDTKKYKTTLCKTWLKKKKCPYGPRCQFLHGHGDPMAIRHQKPELLVQQEQPVLETPPPTYLTSVDWSAPAGCTSGLVTTSSIEDDDASFDLMQSLMPALSAGLSSLDKDTDSVYSQDTFDSSCSERDLNEDDDDEEEEEDDQALWESLSDEIFKSSQKASSPVDLPEINSFEIEVKARIKQKIQSITTANADHSTECSICFSTGADCSLQKCGHTFHASCSLLWMERSLSCPICRATVKDIAPLGKTTEVRVGLTTVV